MTDPRINLALSIINQHHDSDPTQTLREVKAALNGATLDEIEQMREEG